MARGDRLPAQRNSICCAITGQAHDLACPTGSKAPFGLQRQFPGLSSPQTARAPPGLKSVSPAAANGEAPQDFRNNAPPHSETTPSAQAELHSGLGFLARAHARFILVEAGEMGIDEALEGLIWCGNCQRWPLATQWERTHPPRRYRGRR